MAGALCASASRLVDEQCCSRRLSFAAQGMTLSPFNAWVVLKGLETLGIRMRAQSANALALCAEWLSSAACRQCQASSTLA